MARISKAKQRAIDAVRNLVFAIDELGLLDRRAAKEAVSLLRAGCAATVKDGNPEWEALFVSVPRLDVGEAFLHLSNDILPHTEKRLSLEDIYREYPK